MRVVASRSFDAGLVVTLISILMLTISGLVLSSNTISAADYYVDNFSIDVPVSCSLFNTVGTIHTAEVPNGSYQTDIGITTIKAYCNDTNGFSIYAIGYTGQEYGNNKLVGTTTSNKISTGTAQSGSTSNWAMKVSAVTGTYTSTITNSFDDYHAVPDTYTKVATYASATDIGTAMNSANGSSIQTTYAAYISYTQVTDVYAGKVKYTIVHPNDETPLQPQVATSGCINYFPNGSGVEGTMGCQEITSSDTGATLLAGNFSRSGYGFAGWSDAFDYATNANAHFYGPQEDITFTAGQYTGTNNGLALYAVWVKSEGSIQDTTKIASVCNRLTTAATDGTANLSSVSALTDQRDNNTYAIAKLADGKCWMIENLRLDDSATLTLSNTNNPLNDGTNVTLKHNYTDTTTSNTLSATSSVTYNADTAPDGWCTTHSAACDDQSRLRTDNTASRASNPTTNSNAMYSYGNYYNWYSATAGRGTYGFSTNNNSTVGDLCPAGWRLPVGGQTTVNTTGDYYVLTKTLMGGTEPNQDATSGYGYYSGTVDSVDLGAKASKVLRGYPSNYLYSGDVYGGSLDYRGSSGYYWSSTARNYNHAYYLNLGSSYVGPGTNYSGKYGGNSLRCIAPSS